MIAAVVFFLILCSSISGFNFKGREFTLEHSLWLRGFAALLVLFHHMKPELGGCNLINTCYGACGRYCVAVFFFMSGYGLMLQLHKSGDRMFSNYAARRFPKLLIPYCTAWLFTVGCLGDVLPDLEAIGNHWLTGESFLPFSYYVEELCLFYAAFWLCFRFCRPSIGLLLLFIFTISAMVMFRVAHWNNHWWISSIAFPMGALVAFVIQRKINMWWPCFGIACLTSLLMLAMRCDWVDCIGFHAFAVEPLFCLLVVFVIPRLRLRSERFNGMMLIGRISYEFYILSGCVLCWCLNVHYPWYPCLVMVVLLAVARVFHYINGRILKTVNGIPGLK